MLESSTQVCENNKIAFERGDRQGSIVYQELYIETNKNSDIFEFYL